MNTSKSWIIGGVSVLVLAVLGVLFWGFSGKSGMEKETLDTTETTVKSGSYEGYAAEKIMLAKDGPVILFFKTPECDSCRLLDIDLRANAASIPDGMTILAVDFENSPGLRGRYGVTLDHTLVRVDADGVELAKWRNLSTLADLLTYINQ